MADETTLTARYVFPVTGPPLERGTVTFRDDVITDVSPWGERMPGRDLGDAAIVPGFVNAHTHLDLTGARGLTPPTPDFLGWLRRVIGYRKERTQAQVADDVTQGEARCLLSGTTTVGDFASDWMARRRAERWPIRSRSYLELIGTSIDRSQTAWWAARRELYYWGDCNERWPGLGPHAPYSAARELIESCSRAPYRGAAPPPLSIHIAETPEELELLDAHTGPFVDFLRELNAWHPERMAQSVRDVIDITRNARCPAYIHANYLAPDTDFGPNATIVYCPRTHAVFGHPPHPFRDFLTRGVRVALGTDSLASNPDLSVLAEARFVRERYPDVAGAALLRMITLSAAEALDYGIDCGSLTRGKSADFAVVELPSHDARNPHDLLFDSNLPVRATVFRGQLVAGDW